MDIPSLHNQKATPQKSQTENKSASTATFDTKRVTAVIVGAGPLGLSVARQLQGLEYIHNKPTCIMKNLHATIDDSERVYRRQLPHTLPAGRGKTASGAWFDSFQHDEQDRSASCLHWQENEMRKVDWSMISKSQAGGSWNDYYPNQKTFSQDTWMALPDDPISEKIQHRLRVCDGFYKTGAASLCKYYQQYAEQLPMERMLFDCTVDSAYQQDELWHLQASFRQGGKTLLSSKYLVLANGRTKPGHLGIDGEKLEHVSHTTAEAIRKIDQLNTSADILVIGTGLSAADTIIHAREKRRKVTHLLPEEHTRLEVKYRQGKSENLLKDLCPTFYPKHSRLAEYISGSHSSPYYQQLVDYELLKINSDFTCTLSSSKSSINNSCEEERQFDHYAILIGSTPDFSFLKNADGQPLTLGESQSLTPANVVPETMEVKSINNLFLVGSCTGEQFQRFSIGHSVSAAETIKDREQREEQ